MFILIYSIYLKHSTPYTSLIPTVVKMTSRWKAKNVT